MFEIDVDTSRRLILVRMDGMLSPADVAEFARQRQVAALDAGFEDRSFDVLVETGNPVQSQETIAAFTGIIGAVPPNARRIAVVRTGALAAIQARRVGGDSASFAVFYDLASAEAWLAENQEQ